MDRVSQLRGAAGGDSTLDTSSPPSEAYISANDSSSKYFSLSDSFDMSPIKDVSLASTSAEPDRSVTDDLVPLSPAAKDSFNIGRQIEAANILSGGVEIFDDNDNSFDGNELVIDDNVEMEDKSNPDKPELPDSTAVQTPDVASKDMEVSLQIDGKNVNAIDIGNGLYLYRKDGQEELAAVQIIDGDEPQPSFKFLKVRENAEGNLEVYEEIEVEVPKEVPTKEKKSVDKNTPHVPIVDINKITSDSSKSVEKYKAPQNETPSTTFAEKEEDKDTECKDNFNGKLKISESRTSPVIGSFTPMTFHSTPNKEGKPLTKTMVDLQLDPNRHTDNVKKTIEVHTEIKQKSIEPKENSENTKLSDVVSNDTDLLQLKNVSQKTHVDNVMTKDISDDTKADKITNEKADFSEEKDNVVSKGIKNQPIVDKKSESSKENKTKVEPDVCTSKEHLYSDKFEEKKDCEDKEPNEVKSCVTSQDSKVNECNTKNNTEYIKDDKNSEKLKETVEKDVAKESSKIDEHLDIMSKQKEQELKNIIPLKIAAANDNSITFTVKTDKDNEEVKCLEIKDTDEVKKESPKEPITLKPAEETKSSSKSYDSVKTLDSVVSSTVKTQPVEKSKIESVQSSSTKSDLSSTTLNITSIAKEDNTAISTNTLQKEITDNSHINKEQAQEAEKVKENAKSKDDVDRSTTKIGDTTNIAKPETKAIKSDEISNKSEQVIIEPDSIKVTEAIKCVSAPKTLPDITGSAHVLKATSKKPESTLPIAAKTTVTAKSANQEKPLNLPSKVKPVDVAKNIPVPKVTPSDIKTSDIDTKVLAPAIPVLKVKSVEPIGHITVVKTKEQAVLPKTTQITGLALPVPNVKSAQSGPKLAGNTTLIPKLQATPTEPTGQAISLSKAPLTAKSEVKNLEDSKHSDKTTTKPSSQIPDLNKPGSKEADVKQKLKLEYNKNNEQVGNKETLDTKNKILDTKVTPTKTESKDSKETINKEQKPVNNNHTAAVPFGKWTDANRQEFLNKFKEVKAPTNTNSKIKNSNDLNRRDVLKKIDSQRQTIINNAISKAQEKPNVKNETVFSSKIVPEKKEIKVIPKNEIIEVKPKQAPSKVVLKQESQKPVVSSTVTITSAAKAEPARIDLSTATMASLIDRTIEDMISRVVPMKNDEVGTKKTETVELSLPAQTAPPKLSPTPSDDSGSLDYIEMKMNELHGIPFVERPPHELPKVLKPEIKTYSKSDKNQSKVAKVSSSIPSEPKIEPKSKDNVIGIDSDDEVIEHEPITGDMDINKKHIPNKISQPQKIQSTTKNVSSASNNDTSKKEAIITENEFDKFARRNSISYENCLTVNFDKKETHSIVQTVKEKEPVASLTKNEASRIEPKSKQAYKQQPLRQNIHASKSSASSAATVDNKHQSKIHSAYQTLTAKRQVNPPITILEDKPVKVVFLETSTEFVPTQLNVQGQELSPPKKVEPKIDVTTNSNAGVDTDALDTSDENKLDKIKTKHQRKQVLTPVETPELELIQPGDIGLEVSPKKKRKIEEQRTEKSKNLVHKKSYLLGRNNPADDKSGDDTAKNSNEISIKRSEVENVTEHKDAASAIDSLVKAAELLENQSETLTQTHSVSSNTDSQQSTPVKRGRGRPRKYPLPEGVVDKKEPTPQKKPRLIDAKPVKRDSISDDDDSDEEMVRENWTMGKINENIVCPICNKLFRSENVVFKHVKHCTGVSPNRSESDKSPCRVRISQDLDDLDDDESSIDENEKKRPKKRKSKETASDEFKEKITAEDDVIVIEDTPIKQRSEKPDKEGGETKKALNSKVPLRNNISCEICGKTFRQQSYMANHKLQHKKDQPQKNDSKDSSKAQVYSCEICNKEFRKLHHLVQHRIIHNPSSAPTRTPRKSSSEQNDTKNVKEETASKQNDDQNAAFRCEPCDKSFRKLHHLVEHRETHDGINRQKIAAPIQPPKPSNLPTNQIEKPDPPPQCEICKKTFRKLHHLIEHKEMHADVVSDKSDDKSESVKSALSTKDIIHECSSCYMVFPNEHSLNKHSTHCAKKKRQSKQSKAIEKNQDTQEDVVEDCNNSPKPKTEEKGDEKEKIDEKPGNKKEDLNDKKPDKSENKKEDTPIESNEVQGVQDEVIEVKEAEPVVQEEIAKHDVEVKSRESHTIISKRNVESDGDKVVEKAVVPEKVKKVDHIEKPKNTQEIPKKKTPLKKKVAPTVSKRQKSTETPVKVKEAKVENEPKPSVESSDDDDVRYMLNPNFKIDDTSEGKNFMKVRASKRSSLQIERNTPKEFDKRRASLQIPPKIPRTKTKIESKLKTVEFKTKAVEPKIKPKPQIAKPSVQPAIVKNQKVTESVLSTDSDDSDVKYSFPKPAKISKLSQERTSKEDKTAEKKVLRKSSMDKRKSLGGIAKRKSIGKVAAATKHKINTSPVKIIRKRVGSVEHRCDCGQLFSSAALLARHTTLAHTPPRIRRRRSPPPDPDLASKSSHDAAKPPKKTAVPAPAPRPTRKSSVKQDASKSVKQDASKSVKQDASKSAKQDASKSVKPDEHRSKTRRSTIPPAHTGVPMPEKMRKDLQKKMK